MSDFIAILQGLTVPRSKKMARRRRRGGSRLGRAARHCKGKTKGKFRKCLKRYLKRH